MCVDNHPSNNVSYLMINIQLCGVEFWTNEISLWAGLPTGLSLALVPLSHHVWLVVLAIFSFEHSLK